MVQSVSLIATLAKQPAKLDCLKHPSVLQLESLEFSLFHLAAFILFTVAVIHTLSVNQVHKWALAAEKRAGSKTLFVQLLYFLSEVEIVFAFWVIPLFILMWTCYDWRTALEYINTRDYTEPLFVVVILSMTATRPVVHVAESFIRWCAKALGGTLAAWWFTLLTVGPLMGSFITEAGAMAICALLLSRQFYSYGPSSKLAYATIALLFVNISVGGVLTDFASPAVLVLAHCWHWTTYDMLVDFGWKAALGIVISNLLYWWYFRKEIKELNEKRQLDSTKNEGDDRGVPHWITLVHIAFIAWIVVISHYPAV
ncbi:MAG: hypothetical protein RL235_1198, partial [Chlamydiota bacterium]